MSSIPNHPRTLQTLLRRVQSSGSGPTTGDPEEWLTQAQLQNQPVEAWLVNRGLVRRAELLRLVLELKNAYGIPFGADWCAATIPRAIAREQAESLGILPLAEYEGRLYLLAATLPLPSGVEAQLVEAGWTPVVLGECRDLPGALERLYSLLAQYDAEHHPFGEYLVQQGVITETQLTGSLQLQKAKGFPLGQVLVRQGLVAEELVYEMLASYFDKPYYTTARILELADATVTRKVARLFAQRHATLALRVEDDTCWVVTSNPQAQDVLRDVAQAVGAARVQVAIGAETAILNTLNLLYEVRDEEWRLFTDGGGAGANEDAGEDSSGIDRADVPKLVNYLLYTGVRRRASDIHIEIFENQVELRYRIDGSLMPAADNPLNLRNVRPVIAHIKVAANLDIAERRRPQDGVIRRKFGSQAVDFRIAVQPTIWGENMVLRILQQNANVPTLDKLGFTPETTARFRRLMQNPQGLILLTGPTGCGKTTTLYACLDELSRSDVKIVTAEDPVEYAMEGVQQSQVNEAIGNTFDRFLRAFLRLDPDIILVGEIRDRETAEMTIRSALTGHLIFSTLHVNEAVGVVRRLTDLAVEPNLVSQTLLAVISQRLARRICSRCVEVYTPARAVLDEFYPAGIPAGKVFQHGRGCPACQHTGYKGRVALVEYWEPDDECRGLIDRGAETYRIRQAALDGGMLPLVEDALAKVDAGLTTLEELQAILPFDQISRYREHLVGEGDEGRAGAPGGRSAKGQGNHSRPRTDAGRQRQTGTRPPNRRK